MPVFGVSRSVSVRLQADISGYLASMRVAGTATKDAFTAATKAAHENEQQVREIGNVAGVAGAAAAAGVGIATKAYMDFDRQMSSVAAATHASRAELAALRAESVELGADTQFTASEAAQGVEELAKAGVETQEILSGGLKGALDLAAAGEIGVAEAAETAASALTQFNLAGEDVPHVADLLAAGAGKAQGGVEDLSYALSQSGLVASQMGLSLEETVGSLSAFASAGLMGSDAGTSFRTMLLALNPKSEEAGKLMDRLGFSAYDANGAFVGMEELAGRLRAALAGMSAEQRTATLQTIFGQDAIRAANVIYSQGEQGIRSWIGAVDDQGYAAETAALKTDNLHGDIERLGGSVDALLIKMGAGADGPGREFVQFLEGAVDGVAGLPDPLLQAGMGAGALVAALGVGGFVLSRSITGYASLRENLSTVGVTMEKTKARAASMASGTGTALRDFGTVAYHAGQRAQYASERTLAARDAVAGYMSKVGPAAVAVGGFALAQSGIAEKTGLANTATYAMMGTIAGPWGTALGAGVGAAVDFASANDDLADALARTRKAAADPYDVDALADSYRSLQHQIDKGTADLSNSNADFLFGDPRDALRSIREGITNELGETQQELNRSKASTREWQRTFVDLQQTIDGTGDILSKRFDPATARKFADVAGPALEKVGLELDEILSAGPDGDHWDEAVAAIKTYGTEALTTEGRQKALAEATSGVNGELEQTADAAEAASQALHAMIDPAIDLDEANQQWVETLEKLRKELKGGADAYDVNSKKGRANRDLVRDAVGDLLARYDAEVQLNGVSARSEKILSKGVEQLRAYAEANGISRRETNRLIDRLGVFDAMLSGLPDEVRTEVSTPGAVDSKREIKDLAREYDLTPDQIETLVRMGGLDLSRKQMRRFIADINAMEVEDKRARITMTVAEQTALKAVGRKHGTNDPGFWAGGGVSGPGGPTDDLIPAWLSNGEHVWTAAEVDAVGGHAAMERMRADAMAGAYAFANGGGVTKDMLASYGARGTGIRKTFADIDHITDQLAAAYGARASRALTKAGGGPLPQAGDYERLVWRGEQFNARTVRMVQAAERLLGASFHITQGSYSTRVAASGSTHAGGGVFDATNPVTAAAVAALRRVGFAAWHRTPSQGPWPHHIHAVALGDRTASPSAKRQMQSYRSGGIGLARGGAVGRYASGGRVSKDERAAVRGARREFSITRDMDAAAVREAVRGLIAPIREALGRDSDLFRSTKALGDRLVASAKVIDEEREKRTELRDQIAASRRGGADYEAYRSEVSGQFLNDITTGGAGDLRAQLRADRNDATAMNAALAAAAGKGLDGGLYKEIASSGNLALAQEYARMSRAQIGADERLYAQRASAVGRLGSSAADAVYGPIVEDLRKQVRHQNKLIERQYRLFDRLPDRMERGIRSGMRDTATRARSRSSR